MAELVFDVGMCDGKDTAYYLERGYDVVAVEANPEFCAAAEKRFERELAEGRLEIVNVGIADVAGEFEFWVSSHPDWSSFHRKNAVKGGADAVAIRVPTVCFLDLLSGYRPALYVKVDIEMNDTLCVRELRGCSARPRYFSFEAHDGATSDIEVLSEIGYRRFKCLRQNDWRVMSPTNVKWQGQMRKMTARTTDRSILQRAMYRFHYAGRTQDGWHFAAGSSGPLPWELPGRWLTSKEIVRVWEHLLAVDRALDAGGLGEWFDIHVGE